MEFGWTPEQQAISHAVGRLCSQFGDDYWREKDKNHEFPEEFYQAMAKGGWLGVAMPGEFGGSGLGITEAALILQEVTASGACMAGASAIHMNIFGVNPLVVHGTTEQKAAWLPDIIQGKTKVAFGVTEPDVGLDTTHLKTRATREGDHYRVQGRKVWISTAQVAKKILLLTRTTPVEEVARPAEGLTLFFTDLDRSAIDVREIDKAGRAAVDSNELFIDDLMVPVEHRLGEEGKGFRYLLDGLNPERILTAAEAVGIGRVAVKRAARYAKERVVFGRPIGQNQAVQHPLADSWARLEAANLLAFKAAWLYDNGKPCGAEANAAKYLCAEAGYEAADRAMQTHGGFGYSKEFHVERYWREAKLLKIAPVTPELILCYIAERVLG
ncbi:MAG: acyl-CoA/acyl-ACP dehydrogenase, partial [SAR324 cluster bacterium]|nr:acyl-CoA/acyl-ACP dehydrogenase [SAR324 cluster bacterium]